jgi:carbonic anhydrase/acetyltransferase-like protein (isoleucine patch superfamily)
MIYSFKNIKPVIHQTAYIHPLATVTGDVIIGKDVYVGPGAAIRGDWGRIIIEDGCNVQENCTIHMFPGVTVRLEENAHIGHGAIIHGAHIGENVLIGMNAVVMDRAIIGKECIVGALSFIKADAVFERRSLIVGNPAKRIKEVTDEMINWKSEGTRLYQQLPLECHQSLEECEALDAMEPNRPIASAAYRTWNETKKQ